ncbi:hypothetical protein D4764_21G0003250 [Takifugu flavidus]|uniref:Uncharacterized protein n=1 Tax=Takifugu flavidus TaxID=433684 RepID=A0A5C6NEA6_9TELE|nr:hypothetical protein D4764_21G0003250 [Takifugu flavidus]
MLPRPLSFSPWHSDTYQVAGPITFPALPPLPPLRSSE